MRVRVIIGTDTFLHHGEWDVEDALLEPPVNREVAKGILWDAYVMAKMQLKEKLIAEVREYIKDPLKL